MSTGRLAAWGRAALDLLYPRSCAGCGGGVAGQPGHLCGDCLLNLSVVREPFCARCGDPVDGVTGKSYICSVCAHAEPSFDLARSAVRYRGPARAVLHRFKYAAGVYLAGDLAGLLAVCVETHYDPDRIDMTAFVPLHRRRERERSYNQAQALAERLGRRYGKPVFRGLARVRDTGSQTRLNMAERAANVKGAFAVTEPGWAAGKSFLLVDDVMTTGATLREAARALKTAGAARVWVATVARG